MEDMSQKEEVNLLKLLRRLVVKAETLDEVLEIVDDLLDTYGEQAKEKSDC